MISSLFSNEGFNEPPEGKLRCAVTRIVTMALSFHAPTSPIGECDSCNFIHPVGQPLNSKMAAPTVERERKQHTKRDPTPFGNSHPGERGREMFPL